MLRRELLKSATLLLFPTRLTTAQQDLFSKWKYSIRGLGPISKIAVNQNKDGRVYIHTYFDTANNTKLIKKLTPKNNFWYYRPNGEYVGYSTYRYPDKIWNVVTDKKIYSQNEYLAIKQKVGGKIAN